MQLTDTDLTMTSNSSKIPIDQLYLSLLDALPSGRAAPQQNLRHFSREGSSRRILGPGLGNLKVS